MEQPNANHFWRPAASPDRPTPARTLLMLQSTSCRPLSPDVLLRSAIPQNRVTSAKLIVQIQNGFWLFSILYFPSSSVAALPRWDSASRRFMATSAPFCPLSHRPEIGLKARFSVSLNLNKTRDRQPSSSLKSFWGHRWAGKSVQASSAQADMHRKDPFTSFLSSVAKAMEDWWALLPDFRILSHSLSQSSRLGDPVAPSESRV
jgi:hypothetical protein